MDFWNNIAKKINNHFETIYISYQAHQKFNNLIKNYNVSKLLDK